MNDWLRGFRTPVATFALASRRVIAVEADDLRNLSPRLFGLRPGRSILF